MMVTPSGHCEIASPHSTVATLLHLSQKLLIHLGASKEGGITELRLRAGGTANAVCLGESHMIFRRSLLRPPWHSLKQGAEIGEQTPQCPLTSLRCWPTSP